MTEERVYHTGVAAAEKAITDAGYVRDNQRHIWVNPAGKTAKVMREEPGKFWPKFYVQWG